MVAPTSHLKIQWALAAHRLGLQLDPDWAPGQGLARDVHGLVTTYQQVATAGTAKALRGLAADGIVILDEIHHAGDERAWGDGVCQAFEPAHRRLCLAAPRSAATPPRSRSSATRPRPRATLPQPLHVRLRRRAARRRRRAARLLPPLRRRDGVERARRQPAERHVHDELARDQMAPGCAPRCASTATGSPPCSARRTTG